MDLRQVASHRQGVSEVMSESVSFAEQLGRYSVDFLGNIGGSLDLGEDPDDIGDLFIPTE